MAKTRSSKGSVSRRPPAERRLPKLRKPEMIFAILALITVFSLIIGAIGSVVVDQLTNDSGGDQIDAITTEQSGIEKEFRDAAQANPNDPESLKALANYLAQTGNVAEAITWYEKALAINPNVAVTRLAFADALAGAGKRADAELQYKKVSELQPSNPQAHYGLGELYRNWSPPRTADAIVEYQKTIEVGPDSYVAELANQQLASLAPGTPSPIASPASPAGG